ncbi:hypothetical protein VTN49DRAFT_999 [Thermomyces lanuginosus]|uniref:uncharacterized protein n=1 Tax=Thermomyces lanuginosus TaxID=5541 RepID=UPI003741F79C
MLHEILLALSGQPSPLVDPELGKTGAAPGPIPLLSPPEKALLSSLAHLSRLHALLCAHTARISSTHPSPICRAVSSAIATVQLGKFKKKILEVEQAILAKDSSYVGGYGIVPLSIIVSEFAPWTRRLEWLWQVAQFIQPEENGEGSPSTGAKVIDYLRGESHTGYGDLEGIALELVRAAETAWLRQLSVWLLYGELPTFGKDDFFIQARAPEDADELESSRGISDFSIRSDLLPNFVSSATAASILFIGKSLNRVRGRRNRSTLDTSSGSVTGVSLNNDHIQHLSSLKSPISSAALAKAVTEIRHSLSQTSLSKLLPLPKIIEVLSLVHDFLLLGRGEFVMALVTHADARIQARHQSTGIRKGLEGVGIKEGEVAAVLAQTWSEMSSLKNEEDPVDEELDLARDLLHLSINNSSRVATPSRDSRSAGLAAEISSVSFDDLLFPTPTSLTLRVQPPVDLFLSQSEAAVYSKIHSYLLGIRRAQIRLSGLWKHTAMRRIHPSPWGPPRSNTRGGEFRLRSQRERHNARNVQMRAIWATATAALFVLSEIGGYFQGEVVQGNWEHFRYWLQYAASPRLGTSSRPPTSRPGTATRPGTASRPQTSSRRGTESRPATARPIDSPRFSQFLAHQQLQQQQQQQQHDPESVTIAHRRYLISLTQSLFLTETGFTSSLRGFLSDIDHLIALVTRLADVQRNLDLEADDGVVDALVDYAQEERALWDELQSSRSAIERGIKDLIVKLRDIDDRRAGEGSKLASSEGVGVAAGSFVPGQQQTNANNNNVYVPRKPAGVDRLLMKLDSVNMTQTLAKGSDVEEDE